MKCPVCDDVPLSISSREGVEIDFCPRCRGVWLDRGELDKVIERAAVEVGGRPPPERGRGDDRDDDRYRDDRDRHRDGGHRDDGHRSDGGERGGDRGDDRYRSSGKRRKRSFLDDLFEMD